MIFMISLMDGFAAIIFLFSAGLSLINYEKTKNYIWFLIWGVLLIAVFQSLTNVFEWLGILAAVMNLMESFFVIAIYLLAIIFVGSFKHIEKKERGNKAFAYMFVFFMIGIFLSAFFIIASYSYNKSIYIEEESRDLVDIAKSEAGDIDNYLDEMRKNIGILQESNEVKRLLRQNLVLSESAIQRDVDYQARIIAKDVENYIRANPDKTMEDLQQSPEFQKIAVQSVGKEGYSAIYDSNSFEVYFHKGPEFVGVMLRDLYVELPELLDLLESARTSSDGLGGFYDWKETDGTLRRKYGKFVNIPVSTFDNKSFSVAITAYSEDYKMIDAESEYLKDLNRGGDYHSVLLISPDGYVSYVAGEYEGSGVNLKWRVNLKNGISKNYLDVEEKQEISFYGPYIGIRGDVYPKVSVMSPVYDSGRLLGYVAIINTAKEMFDVTEQAVKGSDTRESYLVLDDLLLVSPLRNRDIDIMIQSIETENSKNCFSNPKGMAEHAGHEEIEEFLNYRGDVVIGTHVFFPGIRWCLLSEIEKEEVLSPLKDNVRDDIYFSSVGILFLSVAGFLIGRRFDKRRGRG